MNVVVKFKISDTESIKILVPEFGKKDNLYYKPTERLHEFDLSMVIYEDLNHCSILSYGPLASNIENFLFSLDSLMHKQLSIYPKLKMGKMGKLYNKFIYFQTIENKSKIKHYKPIIHYPYKKGQNIFLKCWVWSTNKGMQTWLYNKNDSMYMEIGETYPWLFSIQYIKRGFISYYPFFLFIKDYKPQVIINLDEATVQKWLEQSKEILKVIWSYDE